MRRRPFSWLARVAAALWGALFVVRAESAGAQGEPAQEGALFLLLPVGARSVGLGQAVAGGHMGRFIYEGMLFLLMTGVVMIVPGLTSLSIVGERERQTFHLLQVTQLSPLQIVLGKLWSSMSYLKSSCPKLTRMASCVWRSPTEG